MRTAACLFCVIFYEHEVKFFQQKEQIYRCNWDPAVSMALHGISVYKVLRASSLLQECMSPPLDKDSMYKYFNAKCVQGPYLRTAALPLKALGVSLEKQNV